MKTWLITGISRGLGLALAKAALDRGDAVIGTVREGTPDLPASPRLRVLTVDLATATTDAIGELVAAAFAHTGRLDVLVNNAGYGLLGATEHATDAELARLFEVNLFAPVRIVRAALPRLRAQGHGHILNITSIAGRAPGGSSSLYGAAKSALEGFSDGLAQELAPLGLHVTAIAPGAFRTDFLSPHSIAKSATDHGYAASVNRGLAAFDAMHGTQLGDPARAAVAILAIADAPAPPVHLLLGSDAHRRASDKLAATSAEMATWAELARSTDFPS